jgi:hypothetical protein
MVRLTWAICGLIAGATLSGIGVGCTSEETPKAALEPPSTTGRAATSKAPAPKPTSTRVEIIEAPDEDDTAGIVKRELARAKADGRTLLVYVGAVWCDPCERFRHAAKAGELDAELPGLRLIELDLDRDRERLKKAGYGSRMIPLFAIPREDGTGSGAQIEGGIKGDGAVKDLTTRLRSFLGIKESDP